VLVPADLRERLPDFLASRRALIEEARQALARGELDAVRRLAHRLAGSFALYGYSWAAQGCQQIEHAPADADPLQLEAQLGALRRHLETVRVTFAEADVGLSP
jgi:FOG: HPt domain